MTWRFIRIQNEEIWISGELNTLVQCMFNSYSKPEGALAETFDVQEIPNGQTHMAIAVAEQNKKLKRFYWWNVKTINTRLRKYMV